MIFLLDLRLLKVLFINTFKLFFIVGVFFLFVFLNQICKELFSLFLFLTMCLRGGLKCQTVNNSGS